MIFRKSVLVKLNHTQILFKEGTTEHFIYIILCGKMISYTRYGEAMSVVGANQSVGEECFLWPKYNLRFHCNDK